MANFPPSELAIAFCFPLATAVAEELPDSAFALEIIEPRSLKTDKRNKDFTVSHLRICTCGSVS